MQLKCFFLFKEFDLIGDITHPYFEVHIICWIELGTIHGLRRNGTHSELSCNNKIAVLLTGMEPSAEFTGRFFGTYWNAGLRNTVVGSQTWVCVFWGLLCAYVAELWTGQWGLGLDSVTLKIFSKLMLLWFCIHLNSMPQLDRQPLSTGLDIWNMQRYWGLFQTCPWFERHTRHALAMMLLPEFLLDAPRHWDFVL